MYVDLHARRPAETGPAILDRFLDDPGTWLPAPARQRGRGGWTVVLEGVGIRRDVAVHVGPVWRDGNGAWRSLRWEPLPDERDVVALEPLLPVFVGELGLTGDELGPHELELHGTYAPPGGLAGGLLDHAGLHRVAEHTAQRLLADVVERLAEVDLRPDGSGPKVPTGGVGQP